ncbi:O-antigen ligase family protein [Roseomonas sp. CCTCC AB2023176]|uniref:O-antigen ligase family protein n=1 Tax=Roseomonas sp. CCTCC AB2023176 TaxID=3342640 RepID=UPI0035DB8940
MRGRTDGAGGPLLALVVPRPTIPALAALAGAPAAAMHLAGALKSTPALANLSFDLTLAAAALLLPALPLILAGRAWRVDRILALPLACCAGLLLWLVAAALWSPSRVVLEAKLPEVVLLGPAMLAAGLLTGADPAARRVLCAASLAIGVFVAASVAHGLATGGVVLGGLAGANPDLVRVQYQLAGLAIAGAAGLAAVRVAEARGLRRLLPGVLVAGLAAAALLPGGRAALLALGATVLLAPAALHWSRGRPDSAVGWAGLCLAGLAVALGLLALNPQAAEGLRTLERFTGEGVAASARPILWGEALRWAGDAAPWGLGTGAFTIASGSGERRGLYPHNHALEALTEAGLPGLLLWLGAFGGGAAVLLARIRHLPPGDAARLVALVLPVAIGIMVSTDLGNRMAWFALGLALSPGLTAAPRHG